MRKPHVSADKSAVNHNHEASSRQKEILEIFRELYVTNPSTIVNKTDTSKQGVQDILDQLIGAGWIERLSRGQYRLVYDGNGYVVQTLHYEHENDYVGVPTLSLREDLSIPTIETFEEPEPVEWMADVPEDEVDLDDPTPKERELDRLLREAGLGEKPEGDR